MAITKTKVLSNGLTGNHWVVKGVYLSPDASHLRAYMDLYTNAAASVTGTPIHSQEVLLASSDNPLHTGKIADLVEQKLVSLPGDFVSGVIS